MYSFRFHLLRAVPAIQLIIIILDCLVIASTIPTRSEQNLHFLAMNHDHDRENEVINNNSSSSSISSRSSDLDKGIRAPTVDTSATRTHQTEEPSITNTNTADTTHSSKDYWRQWLCTKSHEEFLRMFQVLYGQNNDNNRLCPNQHQTHRDSNKDKGSVSSYEQLSGESSTELRRSLTRRKRSQDLVSPNTNAPAPESSHLVHRTDIIANVTSSGDLKLTKLRGCEWENKTHVCQQHVLIKIEEPKCFLRNGPPHLHLEESDEFIYDTVKMNEEEDSDKPSLEKVWGYGLVSCTAVILFARLGVILLPLLRKDLYEKLIITMVGLAAGTLTGSSIFHLLPKAFSLDEQFDGQKYLHRCLVIAAGLWTFLMVERLLKIAFHHNERYITNKRQKKVSNVLASENVISVICLDRDKETKASSNDHSENTYVKFEINVGNDNDVNSVDLSVNDSHSQFINPQRRSPNKFNLNSNQLEHTVKFQEGSLSLVSTEAWMVIVGDGFLDFVDGLSIGTAFQDSILTGFSISLGILLEELPHELGEFAVLLNAGLSFRRALFFKCLASSSTYVGLGVGIWLGGVNAGHYVFALASGMFLYIALVDMIPELNEAAMKSTRSSVRKGLKVLLLQNIGLLTGMAVIYIMAVYEDVFKKF